jgi:integrase
MAWVEKHGRTWRVRYWNDDNTAGSIPGFTSEQDARDHAATINDQRTPATAPPQFLTPPPASAPPVPASAPAVTPAPSPVPVPSALTLAGWMGDWWQTIDVGDNTLFGYQGLARNHLLSRWGSTELTAITSADVAAWTRELSQRYRPATVTAIRKLLAMVLSDAVDNQLLAVNPVRPQRRGRGRTQPQPEKAWATEHQVLTIASRILTLAGPNQALLIITAAYTGMRWGELAGLRRDRCHLTGDRPRLTIDAETGSLHEVNGQLEYGTPKTLSSVRTVTLPPFLAALLKAELQRTRSDVVFRTVRDKHLRRSTFQRRIWAPAVHGTTRPDSTIWREINPALTFHSLRHSHKTWLIEDGVPDVAQARRLGHRMDHKINDLYSHVADSIDVSLLNALETRWHRAISNARTEDEDTADPSGPTVA